MSGSERESVLYDWPLRYVRARIFDTNTAARFIADSRPALLWSSWGGLAASIGTDTVTVMIHKNALYKEMFVIG